MAATMAARQVRSFMGVVADPRTYLNLIYLAAAFPLGLIYFVFLVTSSSLGFGLLIIWVGLPILLFLVLGVYGLTGLERQLSIHLLGQPVPPLRQGRAEESAWEWLKGVLTAPATWKGLAFLLLKAPLGLISFLLMVVLLSLAVGFLSAPVIVAAGGEIDLFYWRADTLPEAFLCSLFGILFGLVTLHLLNGVAWVWAALSRGLLGHRGAAAETGAPAGELLPPAADTIGATSGGADEPAEGTAGEGSGRLARLH